MTAPGRPPLLCPRCLSQVPPETLACPLCNGLVYAVQLKTLSAEAEAAEQSGALSLALEKWREALHLLPPGTVQYQSVHQNVVRLSEHADSGEDFRREEQKERQKWKKRLGPLAALGLILWKFKAFVLIALSKGKLLMLGLTKFSTLSTMALSFGAYWALYGWMFGLGLILSIYVHEMGHVWALRRFGIKASAPAFIPLLGAVVRMKQYPATPREDAVVGMAGPVWGFWGAAATFGWYYASGIPVVGVVAHYAAWINLFNLIPVWQLDGSRAFHALSRKQRGLVAGAMVVAWLLLREGYLLILAGVAVWRLFTKDDPQKGDVRIFLKYIWLATALADMLLIPTPVGVNAK